MAIPERPLKLTFDPDELTLNENRVLEGTYGYGDFREFMLKYSNWTRDEVLNLRRKEVAGLLEQFQAQIREVIFPKANETP